MTQRTIPSALPPDTASAAARGPSPVVDGVASRFDVDGAAVLRTAVGLAQTWWAGHALSGNEPVFDHGLAVATLVADLTHDPASAAAAVLSAGPALSQAQRAAVLEALGSDVLSLVDGVVRMAPIAALSGAGSGQAGERAADIEGLRKMLIAMAQDVRVVLIRIAAHTQRLRWLVRSDTAVARDEAARLALDIFAPLANRLGVGTLKWELEDLAFRILEPETYREVARLLDEKRAERERFIAFVVDRLQAELARAGVAGEVRGRPKHIYSIYRKMRRKGVAFEDLYDISAVRVMVADVRACYTVLGLVHHLWVPIPKEFDDYIAKPKGNDYRSLHTAVIVPLSDVPGDGNPSAAGAEDSAVSPGRAVEVQIRTKEMHAQAELGVAAHWRYKEGSRRDARYEEKVAWLRRLVAWKDEIGTTDMPDALKARLVDGVFDDSVYVLTPQGRVVDLPAGATPVDFAYHVHTDLGHRCRGARVDGVIVPLGTALRHGQRVEIIAAKQGGPSRDWLNPALGFLQSHRARTKVRHWFNSQNLAESIAAGRAVLEKELAREGMTAVKFERIAGQVGLDKVDEMLAQIGRGEIGLRPLQVALRALKPPGEAPPAAPGPLPLPTRAAKADAKSGILVVGVDKLLTVPAKCCKPAPPDPIVGFVSRGRGVTIHRANCVNLRAMSTERLISAQWGNTVGGAFATDIVIEARDRTGLLRDITDILSRERINVTATNSVTRDQVAWIAFTVEVADVGQLARMLAMLREVPGVFAASRR